MTDQKGPGNIAFSLGSHKAGEPEFANGLLVPDRGKMVVDYLDQSQRPPKLAQTTDVAEMIDGIDWIELKQVDGQTYKYTLFIMGRATGYDTKLVFKDLTNDTYVKRIYSKTPNIHTIDFNSVGPSITYVSWEY